MDTIDRIDFSNETVSAPGKDLPVANQGLAAVSSSSYGYFGGGFAPSSTAVVNRFDFFSETFSAPGNDLTQARGSLAALSNSSYGYFGGGTPKLTTVDRIDFSNETVSASGNNLPVGRNNLGAVSGNSYGYFAGGENFVSPSTSYRDDVFRMDFSNETFAGIVLANNLSAKKAGLAGTSSNSYGYFGGGAGLPIPNYLATVDRIDFTTHICSATGNNLPQARSTLAAVSN